MPSAKTVFIIALIIIAISVVTTHFHKKDAKKIKAMDDNKDKNYHVKRPKLSDYKE